MTPQRKQTLAILRAGRPGQYRIPGVSITYTIPGTETKHTPPALVAPQWLEDIMGERERSILESLNARDRTAPDYGPHCRVVENFDTGDEFVYDYKQKRIVA